MLLPELQVLTSKDVPSESVVSWLSKRYPSARLHVGDGKPADSKWTIWLRVEPSGHQDWPCAIVLAFTQDDSLVGRFPEFELAEHLGASGVDCLVPPRGVVKNLPKKAGWTFALLGKAWHLADFRGDEAGPRGFEPSAGAPRKVSLDVAKLEDRALDFKAL